ncbi:MAG: beta/gamma crystallin family protein [Alphaproteobacteria bacterium]|nr:beta/gamma crystallin family protein [Alphaproteobacteria bacterium]
MRISNVALLGAAAALLLSVTTADAARRRPPPARAEITLYQEDNYGGDARTVREDQPDLDWIRFDDRVSSVAVRAGVWELCEHSHYRGSCITVDGDVAKLSRLRFDDKISSVRRIR